MGKFNTTYYSHLTLFDFLGVSSLVAQMVKHLPAMPETGIRSLGSGRFPEEENVNSVPYACLGNPIDRGAWWTIVHGVASESDTTERLTLSLSWKKCNNFILQSVNWASLVVQQQESTCQYRRHGLYLCVRKIPWRRKWQYPSILLPGKSQGQRRLVSCSPWGCKEMDTTEQLNNKKHVNYTWPDHDLTHCYLEAIFLY